MSVVESIVSLKSYPAGTSEAFRKQLEMGGVGVDSQRHEEDAAQRMVAAIRGIDRSKEFLPIARPSIVKAMAR